MSDDERAKRTRATEDVETAWKIVDKWRKCSLSDEEGVALISAALTAARAEALEEAAKVAEGLRDSGENGDAWTITRRMAFNDCAAAIRALPAARRGQ